MKTCYAYDYKGILPIFDFQEIEEMFFQLEEETLYPYKHNRVNLKQLDHKSYRIVNRIRMYMKDCHIENFNMFIQPLGENLRGHKKKGVVNIYVEESKFYEFLN